MTRFIVVDELLPYPKDVRASLLTQPFVDYASPWDAVTYPGICSTVPEWITRLTQLAIMRLVHFPIKFEVTFARATYPGVAAAPNKIHSDRVMGDYAAHLYLSEFWPSGAGTSFWTHKTQGEFHTPQTDAQQVQRDTNNREAWSHNLTIPGKFNRILIHDANLWHCAEPVGGWGGDPKHSRLVLTTFFKKV